MKQSESGCKLDYESRGSESIEYERIELEVSDATSLERLIAKLNIEKMISVEKSFHTWSCEIFEVGYVVAVGLPPFLEVKFPIEQINSVATFLSQIELKITQGDYRSTVEIISAGQILDLAAGGS